MTLALVATAVSAIAGEPERRDDCPAGPNPDSSRRSYVAARFGFDDTFNVGLAFGQCWNLPRVRRRIDLRVDVVAPVLVLDTLGDWQLGASTAAVLYQRRGWVIIDRVRLALHRADNRAADALSLQIGDVLSLGYFGRSWMLLAEAAYQGIVGSHIVHSEYYRSLNPSLRDGWYGPGGGYFHFGLRTGVMIRRQVQVVLGAGLLMTQAFKLPVPPTDFIVPGYLDFEVSYHF